MPRLVLVFASLIDYFNMSRTVYKIFILMIGYWVGEWQSFGYSLTINATAIDAGNRA